MSAPLHTVSAASSLPLLAPRDLAAPIAWVHGQPVSGARFLADVQAQAALLPPQGPLVNLLADRYRFMVGFGAALLRGRTSLFPPNAMADTLAALQLREPQMAALCDDSQPQLPGLQSVPLAAASTADSFDLPRIPEHLVATCLLTSGSTGMPQPHARSWGLWTVNVAAAAAHLAELAEWPSMAGVNIVATVPAQHSYGFESSVLLALLGGAAIDAGRPFYPADVAAALARLPAPRALVTTPFHLKTLLLSGVALPPVDLVLSATAPLSPQLAQQSERVFGGPLLEIYGCTEAGQVAMRRTAQTELWHTLGELRVQALLVEGEERYAVQGGHVPEPTLLADVLQLQDPQHFRLLGRANDLIHVAGKRSSLGHLNYHLNSIEGVLDGAFWLPDDVADGVVRTVAFVVAPSLSAADIVARLRPRVEAAFLPRKVVHLPSLPREATGKLTHATLRELARQHLKDAS
jgi:acyl-coenzyme A synthetase/AMP-(fatty) acid ligase